MLVSNHILSAKDISSKFNLHKMINLDFSYLSKNVDSWWYKSKIKNINDTNYPYEDNKNLYLKPEGIDYKEWGNGYGEITPHQDDLYEDISTDLLALTVCRDQTKTPTTLIFTKDIINKLNDEEIEKLFSLEVEFVSGKNVGI